MSSHLKKVLSLFLCAVMLFSMVPASYADEGDIVNFSTANVTSTKSADAQTLYVPVYVDNSGANVADLSYAISGPAGAVIGETTLTSLTGAESGREAFSGAADVVLPEVEGKYELVKVPVEIDANAIGEWTVTVTVDLIANYATEEEWEANPSVLTSTVTVSAPSYEVTWEADGVTYATTQVEEGQAAAAPAVDPSKEGFSFDGWYLSTDATQTVITDWSTQIVTGAVTYVAKFTEIPVTPTYTVTFAAGEHAAAGYTVPEAVTVNEGESVYLPLAPDAADGFTFSGWNDGTNTYEAGAEYVVNGNVTVTAEWEEVEEPSIDSIVIDAGTWVNSADTPLTGDAVPGTLPVSQYYYSSNFNVSSSSSAMTITINSTKGGLFSFDYISSGEGRYDHLTITVNGTATSITSGTSTANLIQWTKHIIACDPGETVVTLTYSKDSSLNKGSDRAYAANIQFASGKQNVNIFANDQTMGSVTSTGVTGGKANVGSTVTVNATVVDGYGFMGWYDVTDGNNTLVAETAEYTFTVVGDIDLEARFAAGLPALIINYNTEGGKVYFGGTGDAYGSYDGTGVEQPSGAMVNGTPGGKKAFFAVANAGYRLEGWFDEEGTKLTSLSGSSPISYVHTFTENDFIVTPRFVRNEDVSVTVVFDETVLSAVEYEVRHTSFGWCNEKEYTSSTHPFITIHSGDVLNLNEYDNLFWGFTVADSDHLVTGLSVNGVKVNTMNGTYFETLIGGEAIPNGSVITIDTPDNSYQNTDVITVESVLIQERPYSYKWDVDAEGVLHSTNQGAPRTSSLLKLIPQETGIISFEVKVSSEKNYDKFVYGVGAEPTTSTTPAYSGEVDWTLITIPVTAGQAVYFGYCKDSSSDSGEDTAYIRNLRLVYGSCDVSTVVDTASENEVDAITVAGLNADGTAQKGSDITFTAVPDTGRALVAWLDGTGKVLGTGNPLVVTALDDLDIHARFADSVSDPTFTVGNIGFNDLNSATAFALANSDVSDVVVMVKDYTLTQNATIPSGVSLLLPYEAGATTINSGDTEMKLAYANTIENGHVATITAPGTSVSYKLTLNSAVLTVADGAKLIVGGKFSGGQPTGGQTYGAHSEITLDANSEIILQNGAVMSCFGYITGAGKITAESGAQVYEPFVCEDFCGGSLTGVLYADHNSSPFVGYSVMNIRTDLVMFAGSELYGYCTLYAGGGHNSTTSKLISTSDSLLNLTSGKLTCKYEPTSNMPINQNGRTKIIIEGDANYQGLRMYVYIEVDCGEVDFPVPYSFDIEQKSGTLSVETKVVLMPGAKVTIEEGAALQVNGSLVALDGYIPIKDASRNYPNTTTYANMSKPNTGALAKGGFSERARLIVNGSMTVADNAVFAGIVETTGSTGTITVGNSTLTKAFSHGFFKGESYWGYAAACSTMTEYPTTARIVNSEGEFADLAVNTTYYAIGNNSKSLEGFNYYYYIDGDSAVKSELKTLNYAAAETINGKFATGFTVTFDKNCDEATGTMDPQSYAFNDTVTLNPFDYERENYHFAGWATDPDGEAVYDDEEELTFTPADGDSLTLYAVWEIDTYTITWVIDGVDEQEEYEYGQTPAYEGTPVKVEDTHRYTFTGWTPEIVPVTEDATYTAVFASELFVAEVNGTKYTDLASALNAVPADGTATTVTLLADIAFEGNAGFTIPATKNVVLELNGKTITQTVTEAKGSTLFTNKGTLTVQDSSEEGTGKILAQGENVGSSNFTYGNYTIENNGTLTIKSGTVECNLGGGACYAVDNNSSAADAITNLEGGMIKSDRVAMRMFCNSDTKENTLNQTGGSIYGVGGTGLWIQLPGGTKAVKATLNVSDGEIKTDNPDGYAFYDYSYSNPFTNVHYDISGGEFTGYVFSYGANIDITGGTFNGGVYIKQAQPSDVTISGGVFNDECYTYGDNASTNYISGGEFKYVVEEGDCAIGYRPVTELNENGYYTVTDKFIVTFVDDDDTVLKAAAEYTYNTAGSEIEKPADPEKAATAQYTYSFEGWSDGTNTYASDAIPAVTANVTYKAVYSSVINEYTITWIDGNGAKLKDDTVQYGVTPAYSGETPLKAADAQYTYNFNSKWSDTQDGDALESIPSVTGDATYYALFDGTLNEYTVRFVDEDETTSLSTYTVAYGDTPEYTGEEPEKEETVEFLYGFAGWRNIETDEEFAADEELPAVTGDVTYAAIYEEELKSYSVTWDYGNGDVAESELYDYGEIPALEDDEGDPIIPIKMNTAKYTYAFIGWKSSEDDTVYGPGEELPEVTGDVTYTAQYSETINQYKITFVDEDGVTVLDEQDVDYDATPVYAGSAPTKEGNAQYSYTFSGWSPTVVPVTGIANYTATYEQRTNEYTVTWYDEDGTTVLFSKTVEYGTELPTFEGEVPTKASTVQYNYTFDSWVTSDSTNIQDGKVVGAVNYTAQYTETTRQYTVTFVDEDGETVLDQQTLDYGATPVYAGEIPTKEPTAEFSFTFDGWDKNLAEVSEDTTYTAKYASTVNKYTITWMNYNGTATLETAEVEYGQTPEYHGTEPTRAATTMYSYTFAGWNTVKNSTTAIVIPTVTGDAAYYAAFSRQNNMNIRFAAVSTDGTYLAETDIYPFETVSATQADVTANNYTVPAPASVSYYKPTGLWVVAPDDEAIEVSSVDELKAVISDYLTANGVSTITVAAQYERMMYTLNFYSVIPGGEPVAHGSYPADGTQAKVGTSTIVTGPHNIDKYVFDHWVVNGQTYYTESFSFMPTTEGVYEAVAYYVEPAESEDNTEIAFRISQQFAEQVGSKKKIGMTLEVTVPEGYQIENVGFKYTTSTLASARNNVAKYSTSRSSVLCDPLTTGTYTLRIVTTKTVYAIAYLEYLDDQGVSHTLYATKDGYYDPNEEAFKYDTLVWSELY